MIQQTDFFFEGGRSGVLLIHGLTGTPMEMRLLGKGLNRAGFTVHGMQLAGHCGDVEDLLATGWRDWYASVERAADELLGKVDHLFVAGLSMGALLALKLAADRPGQVAGVGVYGATFRYDGWSIPWLARLSFLLPLLKRFGIGRARSFMEQPPYGIRDERLRAQVSTAMLGGDSAAAGLPGNPWYSLAEMHGLAADVRRQLSQVSAPCLVAHASEDDVASLKNAELVMRGVSAPTELLLLDDSYHMITIDKERRTLIERSAAFFDSIAASTGAQRAAA
ncbi:alpha/beta fold hydrolase [Rhodanobacter sp. T12-5]|uniref:alpha/beta hydrolase n=1 Tax=Rhodanobacter sp. T12-5 TaxID=2024611 RepID=UPI0011EE668B|nr:alpha/beta fold hydrolase [Rhodanobacter sp. T12-5]KAA0069770.1 alpha/beta fold hydrolase [Rhodanobacter sp. T12-5]